jgi:hypothetical protein
MKTHHQSDCEFADSPSFLRLAFAPAGNRRGTAIIAALIVVVIVSALVGVAFVATNAASRMGGRAKDYVSAQRAAEAAVEYGYGIWKRRIFVGNGAITTAVANANLSPTALPGFTFASASSNGPLNITATDEYGAPTASPVRVPVSLLDYPGWKGFSASYLVSAKVNSVGQLGSMETAGVKRRFQYVEVPIFQMMYFFQHDLEFYKPASMIIGGLVHTNANLYASQVSGLTFTGNVSYAGNTFTTTSAPPGGAAWSAWSGDQPPTFPNGQSNQVSQVPVAQPMGLSLTSLFSTTDGNPNTDGYQEIIQQPVAGYTDAPEIAVRRMVNKAGIVMTINGTTATLTLQNGTTATAAQQTTVKSAFTGKTTMYDQREGKTVDVANIDVSVLTPILNTLGGTGFNGVMYIVDNTPVTTSGTSPSPNPKTIRLKNGGVLPNNGLTVASENPVYVQGDYNTGTTTTPTNVPANSTGNPNNTDSPTVSGYTRKPSSIMGDAVMFLSNAWNDANSSLAVASRVASNTTYNTAVLAGFMPSLYQPASGSQYGYSGGGNNYPRFLENWSSKSCTYYGSMVELFQSQKFTGKWDTGNIYSPPTRRWNYDPIFSTTSPPGSLICVVYTRGTWAKY